MICPCGRRLRQGRGLSNVTHFGDGVRVCVRLFPKEQADEAVSAEDVEEHTGDTDAEVVFQGPSGRRVLLCHTP